MRTLRSTLMIPVMALALAYAPATWAGQNNATFETDFRRADQLVQANRMHDALPLLEDLYARSPDHPLLLETFAYAMSVAAAPDPDAAKRKAMLLRARELAEKAQKLGRSTPLLETLLTRIPPDGDLQLPQGPATTPEAAEALQQGEVAFSRGDLEAAVGHYERALKLAPTLYEAPLFAGDAYYKMGKLDRAGESYAKAIKIDPDRETAYRYWGDVLLRAGKLSEAKEKFVEAVISEPYARETWQFLSGWAQRARVQLGHPRIDVPRSSSDGKTITILVAPTSKADGSDAWISYQISKAAWQLGDSKLFKEAYPNEQQYRHSLREESASLALVAETIEAQLKEGKLRSGDLEVSIANLVDLRKKGLIEAFVLFAMPDEGIVKDYEDYRKQDRKKLRQYLNDVVTGGR